MVNERTVSASESTAIPSIDGKIEPVAQDKSESEIELYVQLEEVFY
jgi:hypothetical protein